MDPVKDVRKMTQLCYLQCQCAGESGMAPCFSTCLHEGEGCLVQLSLLS